MEKYCTLVISHDKAAMPSQQEIMAELEKADVGAKTRAIKKVLLMLLNGERMPKLVMTVIRCVLATMATLVASMPWRAPGAQAGTSKVPKKQDYPGILSRI